MRLSRRAVLASGAAAATIPLFSMRGAKAAARTLGLGGVPAEIALDGSRPSRILDIYLFGHGLETRDLGAAELRSRVAAAASVVGRALERAGLSSLSAVVPVRHDIAPHQLLAPLAIAGTVLGAPGHTGLGAIVERRGQAAARRDVPYSYVVVPADMGASLYVRSAAMATVPGAPRPLLVRLSQDGSDPFARRLSPDPRDAACEKFVDKGRSPVGWKRAGAFDTARLLLGHEGHPARYVFVADGSRVRTPAAEHLLDAIGRLGDRIDPRGDDRGLIGLDDTLVVVHADLAPATRRRDHGAGLCVLLGAGAAGLDRRIEPLAISSGELRRLLTSIANREVAAAI